MSKIYDVGVDSSESNCLSLHRNENLFIDHAFLSDLAVRASKEMHFHSYPESMSQQLRKAISEYHCCGPEEVYVGNGADGVLADLLLLLREKYDEIGTQSITYRVYPYLCKRYGYRQKLLNETDRLWIIDSPNSITGETFDFSFADPELLIWDNVYGEYDLDGNTEIEKKRRANQVKIHSFSKFYGLASLRIGYCIAPPELVSELLQRKDVFNVNGFAQKMAISALANREHFNSAALQMQGAKKKLIEGLLQLGFSLSLSKANFVWVTHPQTCMRILQKELSEAAILVRHFDEILTGNFIRITVPPSDSVDQLLQIIKTKV